MKSHRKVKWNPAEAGEKHRRRKLEAAPEDSLAVLEVDVEEFQETVRGDSEGPGEEGLTTQNEDRSATLFRTEEDSIRPTTALRCT